MEQHHLYFKLYSISRRREKTVGAGLRPALAPSEHLDQIVLDRLPEAWQDVLADHHIGIATEKLA